jgi:hypothetical protein
LVQYFAAALAVVRWTLYKAVLAVIGTRLIPLMMGTRS